MTNSSWKDASCSRTNKTVTAVCNMFLASHALSNHGLQLVHKLSCMLQTSVSLHARVCIIYWMDACLCSECRSCVRSALLRICHFIHTDLLVSQRTAHFLHTQGAALGIARWKQPVSLDMFTFFVILFRFVWKDAAAQSGHELDNARSRLTLKPWTYMQE